MVSGFVIPTAWKYLNQPCLAWSANALWPMNSPAIAIRNIQLVMVVVIVKTYGLG